MPTILEDLINRATAKIAEVTDDMEPDAIREIQQEHDELLRQIRVERTRANTIMDLARTAKVVAFGEEHVRAGTDVEAFRAKLLEQLVAKEPRIDGQFGVPGGESPRSEREAMAEALFGRISPSHSLSHQARHFGGMTVVDVAKRILNNCNIDTTGLSAAEVITRGLHSTSDFPLLLGDVVGRVLRSAYAAAPSGIKRVARQATAPDFRAKRSLQFSEAPRLEKVNEHGEFKRGSFSEAAESYKVETFGKVFAISRQALINDDLNCFDSIPRRLGQAAASFEAQSLADLIATNPAMGDGKAVFHADHKNLAAAGATISLTSVSAARAAMRGQVGLSGELISVTPRFLIVPSALETAAEQLVAQIVSTKIDDTNVFAGRLEVIVEPRLVDSRAWYIAADPSEIDGLEFSHLEGNEGAQIDTRAGFDVDGSEIRVRLDFGCGWIDHRGWFKNPGA